jgi:glutathione S-transferase
MLFLPTRLEARLEERSPMAAPYRIYGGEMSPYSVKVRSYCRYKGIPHEWIVRNSETQAEYQKYAKLPIIPLVVTPDDEGIQDSTPILERLEGIFPKPSIHPDDPVCAFVSVLIEEFGDEWGNKWMFHYRWARDVDQIACAGRIARTMMPGVDEQQHAAMTAQVRERMVGRVWFVGSSEQTAPQIEESFLEALDQIEAHLQTRAYLFGDRPAFGDFGLAPQIYEAWTDPTIGAYIEGRHPRLLGWLQRMCWPRIDGDFERWSDLEPTLLPVLERHVGGLFVPWTLANAAALEAGDEEFSVELLGRTWTQKPQKYHAKSLRALREKYAVVAGDPAIDSVLERAGCLAGLAG